MSSKKERNVTFDKILDGIRCQSCGQEMVIEKTGRTTSSHILDNQKPSRMVTRYACKFCGITKTLYGKTTLNQVVVARK